MHFSLHAVLFVSSLIVWMPVREPAARDPAAAARPRGCCSCSLVGRADGAGVVPHLRSTPLYRFYEHVPHLFGLSTLEDQQLAGLIMKIGAGLLLWVIIAVVFFRWAAEEDGRTHHDTVSPSSIVSSPRWD